MSTEHPLLRAVKPVVDAAGATLVSPADREPSDVPLVWEGQVVGAVRMPPLHGALDRLIDTVETELGGPLPALLRVGREVFTELGDLGIEVEATQQMLNGLGAHAAVLAHFGGKSSI